MNEPLKEEKQVYSISLNEELTGSPITGLLPKCAQETSGAVFSLSPVSNSICPPRLIS